MKLWNNTEKLYKFREILEEKKNDFVLIFSIIAFKKQSLTTFIFEAIFYILGIFGNVEP